MLFAGTRNEQIFTDWFRCIKWNGNICKNFIEQSLDLLDNYFYGSNRLIAAQFVLYFVYLVESRNRNKLNNIHCRDISIAGKSHWRIFKLKNQLCKRFFAYFDELISIKFNCSFIHSFMFLQIIICFWLVSHLIFH